MGSMGSMGIYGAQWDQWGPMGSMGPMGLYGAHGGLWGSVGPPRPPADAAVGQFGAVQFSAGVEPVFSLADYAANPRPRELLAGLRQLRGLTDTFAAIAYVA